MVEITTKYRIDTMAIKVNKRELLYDLEANNVIYAYKGINKKEFKFSFTKWCRLYKKYKIFCIIEKEVKNNENKHLFM